jgi:hypothetical protein
VPSTSGSPTQIATSVQTKAELSGVIASQFKGGDLGFVADELVAPHGPLYVLVLSGGPPVDGADVLPVFDIAGARWVSLSLVGGAGKSEVLVFRPGGVAGGNVYVTWPSLVAACAALSGLRILWLDSSILPCEVLPGVWNLGVHDEVQIWGDGTQLAPTPLTWLAGAEITEVSLFRDVAIIKLGPTPGMRTTSPNRKIIFTGTSTGVTGPGATGPFIQNDSSLVLLVICDEYAGVNTGPTPFIHNALVGANVTIQAFQGGFFLADVLSGVAGAAYSGIRGSSSSAVVTTQAGVPGGVIVVAIWDIADGVQYNDALVAPPLGAANVQAAIDALKVASSGSLHQMVFAASGSFTVPIGITRVQVYGRPGACGGSGAGGGASGFGGGAAGGGGGAGRAGSGGGSSELIGPYDVDVVPAAIIAVIVGSGGFGGAGGAGGAGGVGVGGGGSVGSAGNIGGSSSFGALAFGSASTAGPGAAITTAGAGSAGAGGPAQAGPNPSASAGYGRLSIAGNSNNGAGAGGGPGVAGTTPVGTPNLARMQLFGNILTGGGANGVGGAADVARGGGGGGGAAGAGGWGDFGHPSSGALTTPLGGSGGAGGAGNAAGAGGAGAAGTTPPNGVNGGGGGGGGGGAGGGSGSTTGGSGGAGGAGSNGSNGLIIVEWWT